jgi:hypothetical protein
MSDPGLRRTTKKERRKTNDEKRPTSKDLSFEGAFLRKLERLSLVSRRSMPGPTAGSRRSPRHGSSAEFSDFRAYSVGDDFRRIDWSAYARLDRLFLRLYRAEEVTTLTLLLDRSQSMHFGRPSKALTAARLAAVLSFIALHNNDRVSVLGWSKKIDRALPAQAGKALVPHVWRFIGDLMSPEPPSATRQDLAQTKRAQSASPRWADLAPTTWADKEKEAPADTRATDFAGLRDFGVYRRQAGLAVVLSDFLTDTDWRGGLRSLQTGRQEVTVIQVLSPDELKPGLRGDWTLRDAENSSLVEVTVTPRLIHRYEQELEAHVASLREFCRHEGIAFVQLASDVSIQDTAMAALRQAGVVG